MNPKVILVGGTSHTGKSTLAAAIADRQSRDSLSTDRLARHPGRPWGQKLPAHVADYYQGRDGATLASDVLRHYRENVWPIVLAIVRARLNNPFDHPLVLEGSAVLPEQVGALRSPDVHLVMLSASHEALGERIRMSCDWETLTERERDAVQAFIDRTQAFDRLMRDQARSSGIQIESGGIDDVLSRIAGDQIDPSQVDRTAIDE